MLLNDECKGCSASVRHTFTEIKSKMDEFVTSIAEEDRVSDQTYRERLKVCLSCPGLYYETTCRFCGCFIQMRAIRKNKSCPYPGDSKW